MPLLQAGAASRPRHVRSRRLCRVAAAAGRDRGRSRTSASAPMPTRRGSIQLPPRHPSGRARLRPAYQRDRACRLTTAAARPFPSRSPGWTAAGTAANDSTQTGRLTSTKCGGTRGCRCSGVGPARDGAARVAYSSSRLACSRSRLLAAAPPAARRCRQSNRLASRASGRLAARPSRSNRSTARRRTCSTSWSRDLNDEAGARQIAVVSRDGAADLPRARLCLARRSSAARPRSPGSGTSTTPTSSARCASPARKPAAAGKRRDAWAAADEAGAPPHGQKRYGSNDRALPQFILSSPAIALRAELHQRWSRAAMIRRRGLGSFGCPAIRTSQPPGTAEAPANVAVPKKSQLSVTPATQPAAARGTQSAVGYPHHRRALGGPLAQA